MSNLSILHVLYFTIMSELEKYVKASNRLMDEMMELSLEQFLFKKGENEWNLAEVIHHLKKVEYATVHQILYYNSNHNKLRMRIKNHFNTMLLIAALYLPKKYKVPVNAIMPDVQTDNSILGAWGNQQKDWLSDERLHPAIKNQVVFKHPIAGYFNFSGTFAFLLAHLNHHLIQVNTIRMNKNFPG